MVTVNKRSSRVADDFLLHFVRGEGSNSRRSRVAFIEPTEDDKFDARASSMSLNVSMSASAVRRRDTDEKDAPPHLWITGTTQDINGKYTLVKECSFGMPMWRKEDYTMYSDSCDMWKVVKGEGIDKNLGCLMSGGGPHGGQMPHSVTAWKTFTHNNGSGEWCGDEAVVVSSHRKVQNHAGYIYTVGRTKGSHHCAACLTVVTPGSWYRCNACQEPEDYDLCQKCFYDGHHPQHQFTNMDYSSFIPKDFLPQQSLTETVYGRSRDAIHSIAQ
eukprot:TRINITY_DN19452_c0_g1_i1.p1 TRINITY_DN19452_c0_g1~~TRINITY_DN19452_c0_g1_i1.p1  ORF type:complete len:272 (+),score=21.52 TRINITY_DN19452_c0_g1_i1:32-847(+)